jgi:hypothetical protein
MTVLTALGNLLPVLPEEETYLALFHGVRRVAADSDGATPHRRRSALGSRPDHRPLKRWLRRWAAVRHDDAAERTILTAISDGAQPAALADLLLAAETDRAFADSGHSLDFINKAFECLNLLGWRHAAEVLPLVVGQLAAARGAEESTEWRQPVDLIALCERAANELPTLFTVGRDRGPWLKHAELAHHLLGDDPSAIIVALKTAISNKADFADLGRSLCYAAALRISRFGTANEHGDWETAHHVFTYCNAVHQGLKRIGSAPDLAAESVEAVRAVFQGAMAVYLIRYLNVPPARLPGEGDDRLKDLPSTVEEIRAALLDAFDRQHRVDEAAQLVARHLASGHPPESIIATLAHVLLREDAGFHAYQILEAGVRSSKSGPTQNRSGISLSRLRVTSPLTRQPSALGCKPQTSRGAYRAVISFLRMLNALVAAQAHWIIDARRLLLPRTLAGRLVGHGRKAYARARHCLRAYRRVCLVPL